MLHDTEQITLAKQYDKVSLMGIVRTTRDYLKAAMGPVGLEYRGRPIILDMHEWGTLTNEGTYIVCVAGMWHLLEIGELTGSSPLPLIVRFLDGLRYPLLVGGPVKNLLGIDITPFCVSNPKPDSTDPAFVLSFLDWLVKEYDKGRLSTIVYDQHYYLEEPMVGADLPGYVTGVHYKLR